MTPDASHSFRYEPGLCTLDEGETLAQWRRRRHEERAGAPPRRRVRSLRRRATARTASPR